MNIVLQRRAMSAAGGFEGFAYALRQAFLPILRTSPGLVVCAEDAWTALLPAPEAVTGEALHVLQARRNEWLTLFSGLARATGAHIVSGAFPVAAGDGRFRMRCDLFHPCGTRQWQDRLHLDMHEEATRLWTVGRDLNVFEVADARIGIASGHDGSFPLPVRAQCQAGADIIVAPVALHDPAGSESRHVAHLVRAMENACRLVTTVPPMLTPLIDPMQASGVLANTAACDANGWSVVHIDLAHDAERHARQQQLQRSWASQYFPAVRQPRYRPAARAVPMDVGTPLMRTA